MMSKPAISIFSQLRTPVAQEGARSEYFLLSGVAPRGEATNENQKAKGKCQKAKVKRLTSETLANVVTEWGG
jgi:hypothetical protein